MPLFLLYLSNIGDILAKSFKWIYARIFLCRICPGVARRRAIRERRKERARTLEPYLVSLLLTSNSNQILVNILSHSNAFTGSQLHGRQLTADEFSVIRNGPGHRSRRNRGYSNRDRTPDHLCYDNDWVSDREESFGH